MEDVTPRDDAKLETDVLGVTATVTVDDSEVGSSGSPVVVLADGRIEPVQECFQVPVVIDEEVDPEVARVMGAVGFAMGVVDAEAVREVDPVGFTVVKVEPDADDIMTEVVVVEEPVLAVFVVLVIFAGRVLVVIVVLVVFLPPIWNQSTHTPA